MADSNPTSGGNRGEVFARRYTEPAILLHWVTAVFAFSLIVVAWVMQSMEERNPERDFFFDFHKSLGLTVWILIVSRLIWRSKHHPPPQSLTTPRWVKLTSSLSHWLLYILFFLMPISGFTASSAGGHGVRFWGIALPNLRHDETIANFGAFAHTVGSYVVYFLLSLHLMATAWHVFVRRDGVLQRMLPPQSSRQNRK